MYVSIPFRLVKQASKRKQTEILTKNKRPVPQEQGSVFDPLPIFFYKHSFSDNMYADRIKYPFFADDTQLPVAATSYLKH